MLQNRDIFNVKNILSDFHVNNEKELQENLMNNDKWHICPCYYCQTEISLLNCSFSAGNPCCSNGCKQ